MNGFIFEKIKKLQAAHTFKATNLITNGHFTENVTGWKATNGTGSVEGGCFKYTVNTPNGATSRITTTIPTTIIGHQYYIFGMVKLLRRSGFVKLAIGTQKISFPCQEPNELRRYSSIITVPEEATVAGIFVDTSAYSQGEAIYFDNIGLIDLTAVFGAGQEPSKNKMDDIMLSSFENGYFDGSNFIVTIKDIFKSNDVKYGIKIGGVGQSSASITSGDNPEYVLSAIKNLGRRSNYGETTISPIPQLSTGYLYHLPYGSHSNDIFYSANTVDNISKIGTLDFNPYGWVSAVSNAGDIIWVKYNSQSTKPRVCTAGSYNSSTEIAIDSARLPSGWLQNCGIDFAFDSNGNEYFCFSEYNVNLPIYIWKVTQPYTNPANWRKVFTMTEGITHFHTCNYDPYNNVWYATSGDRPDSACVWWYSANEGETWTELTSGITHFPAQVSRVLNFVFTEDYIYWANDFGINHCLSRVSRDINGVADPTTWEKLAELNKNQSTYATVLMHSPNGILLLDRVDSPFSNLTDELEIQFWDFETEELYTLKTLKRDPAKAGQEFGFRCKAYSLYQGIYDTRIVVGFESNPNWLVLPYNVGGRRTTLTLDVF